MNENPLTIFVSHPSSHLTDCDPHGDGLVAFEFITRLAARGHRLHVCVQGANIAGDLPSSVTLHPIEKKTPADTLKPIEYAFRVWGTFRRIQKEEHIDLIHQMNPVRPGLSALLSFMPVPLVLGLFVPSWPAVSSHGTKDRKWREHIVSFVMKQADRIQQRNAAALLLSTPAARQRLYKPEGKKSETHVVPYGIDIDQFNNASSGGGVGQTILYLGRLHQEKGIFTLLDAMPQVEEAAEDVHLIIAGDGPEEDEVKKRVEESSWSDHVSLLGRVARSEVPGLMANCDVFCVPSHGEPFGMSALEAMAMGKPIVATDAGGLAHLVPDKGGYKVPPQNPQQLAKALTRVFFEEKKTQKMGKHNLKLVKTKYRWTEVVDDLEKIYLDLVK